MSDKKKFVMRDDMAAIDKATIERLRDNMLIALAKRNGGEIKFTVEEIDMADDMMVMAHHKDPETGRSYFIVNVMARQ